MVAPFDYQPRIADGELQELLDVLPAVSIEGPRAVGKTRTALRRAGTVYALDDPEVLNAVRANPHMLTRGDVPILIDEWQRYPSSWDIVRRSVDEDFSPGRYILTGSARPQDRPTHSGAGRIVTLRMWTTTLAERFSLLGREGRTVSLGSLLKGERPGIRGHTELGVEGYAREIVTGGFPGWRHVTGRARRLLVDGYLHHLAEHDFPMAGHRIRNPAALRRWMMAYSAVVSTTASYEVIRDAATSEEGDKPAKTTTLAYRDILESMWVLEPLAAWLPVGSHISRLKRGPKHHLADTALAARLLNLGVDALLSGHPARSPGVVGRFGSDFLGALFESLVTHDLRVYAQAADARVSHMRTWNDQREVDVIIEHEGGVLPVEVKIGAEVTRHDTRHLRWLRDRLGPGVIDALVVTTGAEAYRNRDGIAVVPAGMLGP